MKKPEDSPKKVLTAKEKKTKRLLDKKRGKASKNAQLSNRAILKMWRARSPKMFKAIDEILAGNNENAKISVIKMGFGKIIPDLKATDLTSGGDKIEVKIDAGGLLDKAYGSKQESSDPLHKDS